MESHEPMEPGYSLHIEGCIKGYHVYRTKPGFHENMTCEAEPFNKHHSCAVTVMNDSGKLIGRVPRGFGSTFWCFLMQSSRWQNRLECIATGKPHVSSKPWPDQHAKGGGAIIPCVYKVTFYDLDQAYDGLARIKVAIAKMGMTDHLHLFTDAWDREHDDLNGADIMYNPTTKL